jgi:hypothetical protein
MNIFIIENIIILLLRKNESGLCNPPNHDLEIFIYELSESLNNVIASAAKQSKTRLLRCARNDGILEFINIF